MSKIYFGDFNFTPTTGLLVKSRSIEKQNLTPTESRVLEYLYLNRDRIVPRNELLNQVTEGRIIGSDNTTTHIKKIRNALGDSAKNPSYIRTYPNSGYRFIAEVPTEKTRFGLSNSLKLTLLMLMFLIAIPVVIFVQYQTHNQLKNSLPVPLTSLKGNEIDGDATPNREYFIFSHRENGSKSWNLIIKKIGEESYFQLTNDNFNDRQAKFSPIGNRIIYHHHNGKLNQIILADINWKNKNLENKEILIEFPAVLTSVYMDWQDEDHILFSSAESNKQVFKVSQFNLKTKQLNIITNPEERGHGDTAITYSNSAKKWAILRNIGWSKTNVMLYDPITKTIEKLASFPHLLLSAAWNDDGGALIVRTGMGELSEIDIETGNSSVVLSTNKPIYAPFNLGNNTFGFMSGDLIVSDIVQFTLGSSSSPEPYITSAFNDFLPTYAQESGDLAFISTRSGSMQIWLKSEEGRLQQISSFTKSPRIYNLTIDRKGRFVAYTANAELRVIKIESRETVFFSGIKLKEHSNPAFSNDGKYIYYSVREYGNWRIERRDIDNLSIRQVITNGFITKSYSNNESIYFMKYKDSKLYLLHQSGKVEDLGVHLDDIKYADQLHIIGRAIYYVIEKRGTKHIAKYSLDTKVQHIVGKTPSFRFSVSVKDQLAFWSVKTHKDTNIEAFNTN